MAFTMITVTVLSCMGAMIIAIVAGHYCGRRPDTGLLEALILSMIVIPILSTVLSFPLYGFVTLNDWPNSPYVLPPVFAVFGAAVLGGFLGFRSGMIWNRGEASCFHCLLSIALVFTGISLAVVLMP